MDRPIEDILGTVRIRELDLRPVPTVAPDATLEEVYRLLEEEHRGAVLVCEAGRIAGIFTERDLLYRGTEEGLEPTTPVARLMSPDPECLHPEQGVAEAIAAMCRGGYRNLPLVDERGRQVGLLSSRDILGFIADHFPEAVLNLPPRLHQRLKRPEGG